MKTIGFPGLGLEFNVDSTAFSLFGLEIKWYGIVISLGMVCAFLLFYRNAIKKEAISEDTIFNITLLVLPFGIIGARFFYVLTKWDYYKTKSFFDIINLRAGGLAIYGGIIFGLASVLIYNKIKKTSSLSMLDALAPGVMLGQAIGRWGNFFNAEAYGWSENIEKFPWRMWLENVTVDGLPTDYHLVHPTFLYESLWNILGLVIILTLIYPKKKFNGQIFCSYMSWYGLGRAFIVEPLRTDSLYIVGKLKFSVFVGILAFVVGIILALILYKRNKSEMEELAEYKPAFESVRLKLANENNSENKDLPQTEKEIEENNNEEENKEENTHEINESEGE